MRVFAEKCVDGIQANRAGTDASAGATLAVATALNGAIGYDKGTVIVKKATASGRPLREVALEEGVDAKLYDETIDLRGSPAETRPERQRSPLRAQPASQTTPGALVILPAGP
jgi:fumarate hydratase class II